jgi:hypothetical protein
MENLLRRSKMEKTSLNLRKNKSVATIVHKYPPVIITGKDIEELKKAIFEEPKFRIQDVSEKKHLYAPKFKPKVYHIQDVFEKRSFYVPKVKPRVFKSPEVFTPKPYVLAFKPKKTTIQQV